MLGVVLGAIATLLLATGMALPRPLVTATASVAPTAAMPRLTHTL